MKIDLFSARQDNFGDFGIFIFLENKISENIFSKPLSKTKATDLARRLNGLVAEALRPPRANPGRHSRTKGHDFERWVAQKLRAIYPGARRHLENHKADAASGTDIVAVGPYRVQCKKLKKYAPITCIEELKPERDLGEVPVLVTAGDRQEPMAVLPFADFLDMVTKLERINRDA